MAKFTLIRHSDGKVIQTDSAREANDLVANGVAKRMEAPKPAKKSEK